MKLLNLTLKYLALSFPIFVGAWAALFYFNLVDEVEDSLDDGLDNIKVLVIQHSQSDPDILKHDDFRERNYMVREIPESAALLQKDQYVDTMMYMINEEDFEPVRMLISAFKHNQQYYEVRVISSTLEKDDLVEDIFYSILALYIILLVSALIINNWILKRTWKPFYSILEKMRAFNLEKNPDISKTPSSIHEFQELDNRLRALADHSRMTFLSQKHFLENASHEIQTPLAISMNKLELLMEQEALGEKDLPKLAQILQNLQRLSRLNKTLLLLNRIENRQYTQTEAIDVSVLLSQLVADFQDMAELRGKRLEMIVQDTWPGRPWDLNRDLANMLFSNLIKNALIHGAAGTQIIVDLYNDGVSVKNEGAAALDSGKIFERFQKNSADSTGNGLGLAIVKAIVDVSSLRLEYAFSSGMHIFSVKKS